MANSIGRRLICALVAAAAVVVVHLIQSNERWSESKLAENGGKKADGGKLLVESSQLGAGDFLAVRLFAAFMLHFLWVPIEILIAECCW